MNLKEFQITDSPSDFLCVITMVAGTLPYILKIVGPSMPSYILSTAGLRSSPPLLLLWLNQMHLNFSANVLMARLHLSIIMDSVCMSAIPFPDK